MQGGGFLLRSIDMEYKVCSVCNREKPISEFHRNKNKKDGHNSFCKICTKEYGRSYRIHNKEYLVEQKKEYKKTENGKIAHKKTVHNYRAKYPDKEKAHSAINNAVRHGKIPPASAQKCSICGNRPAQHYHHYLGYEKEHHFDVMPVCDECHKKIEGS